MQYRRIALCAAIVALATFSFAVAARPALADQDDHNGTYQQQYHGNGTWWNGHWYPNGIGNWANQAPNRGNDRDDRARYDRNGNNGQYYGGAPYYNAAPYYGQAPYYNGAPYNNGYNGYAGGNATLQGVIVGVNGDQLIVRDDSGRGIQVNDQPALNNQTSGRVYVGRSIHAVGYWQNGVFYATQMN